MTRGSTDAAQAALVPSQIPSEGSVADWLVALRGLATEKTDDLLCSDSEVSKHKASILELLRSDPSVKELGKAYCLIGSARECLRRQNLAESEDWKFPALMVRELLVIQMCYGEGPLESVAFKRLVRGVFPIEHDSKLLSELSLAYKTVCDLGTDQEKFDERAPKVFLGLSPEAYEAMFAAYSACAGRSPYTSSASAKGRPRPGRRTQSSQSPEALTAEAARQG